MIDQAGKHRCPGCSCQHTIPPPPEAVCGDLSCKHCGAKDQSIESPSRVCQSCGICAICGSAHTVMVKGPVRIGGVRLT